MDAYNEIFECRICGNPNLQSLLDLGTQALSGVFPKSRDDVVPVAPLHLVKCAEDEVENACGLAQLKHSYNPNALYSLNYGYRSGLNASMVAHLQSKAEKIRRTVSLPRGSLVLDIGSNDCTLLRAMDQPEIDLVGIDPTGEKFKQFYPPHIQLIPDFFSASRFRREFGQRKAKVITSIAMFYDLERPLKFMREIAEILADDGIWVFEQSYLPSMLDMNSYDTICQEHLEYYSLKQVKYMTDRAGLKILEIELNNINGGSFSVVAAQTASAFPQNEERVTEMLGEESRRGLRGLKIYDRFRERVFQHREELRRVVYNSVESGQKLLGYGASTKGNVILQFCGFGPKEVPFIAEVNPDKFGCFTPQTLIPIISEEEARAMKPDGFLVLPWHFRDHILSRERSFLESGGKLIFPLPEPEIVTNAEKASPLSGALGKERIETR